MLTFSKLPIPTINNYSMRILGNILWHIPFLGFIDALLMFIIGTLFTLTVVGAPIGLGLLQLSRFYLSPFSCAMVYKDELHIKQNEVLKVYSLIVRIVYFPFGLLCATIMAFQIAGLFLSIFGIPAAIAVAKALPTIFNPVNRKCVPVGVRDELKRTQAQEYIQKKQMV